MSPTPGPVLVLAPTQRDAHRWAQDNRIPRSQYRLLLGPDDFRGRRGARLVVLDQRHLSSAQHDLLMGAMRWGELAEVERA